MKVLIVNVNAYSGSTGKIVKGLYDYLRLNGHEAKVCYRGIKEDPVDNPDFIPLIKNLEFIPSVLLARLTGLESHFSFLATLKLKKIYKKYQPDVVQLYNIHGNYIRAYVFLDFLKKEGVPVVYSMLDEFPYMGKCAYPLNCEKFKTECKNCPQKDKYPESWLIDRSTFLFHKKERCYRDFKRIIFTGPPYVCQRAHESYLLQNKTTEVLYEPFNFDEYFYPRETSRLRKALGIKENERVVVCASGTYFRKGGHYFVEIAKRLQGEEDLKFIFIGYNRTDWQFTDNIIVKGRINDQNVFAEYMSLADAYVCTSVGDTTPSVCMCALGCGTPLIGFDYGGVKDCAPNEFGRYTPIGDIDAMAQEVSKTKKKSAEDVERIRQYAIDTFSQNTVFSKQLMLYNVVINNNSNDN